MGASMEKICRPPVDESIPKSTRSSYSEACGNCKRTPDDLKRMALHAVPSKEFFKSELDRLQGVHSSCASDAEKMNADLNTVFVHRMLEIEDKTNGDVDLKLINYKEWVQMLQNISNATVRNMELLQKEVTAKLREHECRGCAQMTGSHEAKYRRDISKLLKIIQNGSQTHDWRVDGMNFETLTNAQISSLKEISDNKPSEAPVAKQKQHPNVTRR